ncbi:MAG: energy-coupling factor transporter ATPase [Clostridia bacterium]|nr:energy-coupling factor transporter ATPase [Clostridia bacterium]
MRIQAERLSYSYQAGSSFSAYALKDVTLTIEEGEFFGIIGHTGSGKSTFVQHLNALIKLPTADKKFKPKKPKKGQPAPVYPSLVIGKYDLGDKKTNFKELRSKVGIVFQYPEYQLFAESVYDDVAFGLKNFRSELSEEEKTVLVRDAISAVGLDYESVKDASPFDLSGGQKRRVAIAGVIVTRPEILILDEPAAGLDPLGKKEIMELLHSLHRDWCKTVIIVSHDMDEISENCTRAAVFSHGELKFVLPPSELFLHDEELKALDLDIPVTAKVRLALKAKGIDVQTDFTEEDFAEKVLAYYKGVRA